MLNELSPWHVIIVLLVFALLFGGKKLPEAARGLGRSMRIFRAEMSGNATEPTQPPTAAVPTIAPMMATAPLQPLAPPVQPAPVPAEGTSVA
jgi:sec-independent protein translocase protein TatA